MLSNFIQKLLVRLFRSFILCDRIYVYIIDIEPSAPILSNRAASYIALKEYTKAIDDAKRAIHMDEKFAKAQKRLFKCYLALGDV